MNYDRPAASRPALKGTALAATCVLASGMLLGTAGSGLTASATVAPARVQPRVVSAPTSQWAILATAAAAGPSGVAVLGPRGSDYTDDTVFVGSFSGGVATVRSFSPNLSTAGPVTAMGSAQVATMAAQGTDNIFTTFYAGTNAYAKFNGRTGSAATTYRLRGLAGDEEYHGIVAGDDTVYFAYQYGTGSDHQGGILAVKAAQADDSSVVPTSSCAHCRLFGLGRSSQDDTMISPSVELAFAQATRAAYPGSSASVSVGWNGRAAAGGDDSVYVGGNFSANLAKVNPRTRQVTATTLPVGTQIFGMAAWPGSASADDTVFVADYAGALLIVNGRTLTVDDSVDMAGLYPNQVAVARPDLVYASADNLKAVGVVSGTSSTSAGAQDDSIVINLSLPSGFSQNASLVTNVWVDDSLTSNAALTRTGNTISAKAPAGSGVDHSIIVGLNGGNKIKVGTFTYGYPLTYDANGATSGSAPAASGIPFSGSTNVATQGTMARSGYLFAGWNTLANGQGTPYAASATISTQATTTLYAQWVYKVSYAGGGSTSGSAPSDDTALADDSVTLPSAGSLTRSGYSFVGWGQVPDDTGTILSAGALYRSATGDDTLYAQWTANPAPIVPPGPPTGVSAVAGNAAAAVSWSAPEDSGSFAVTQYQVTASPGGASCMTAGLSCTVTGLTNGVSYTFTVSALSGAGWGAASAPSSPVTPSAAPTPAPDPEPVPPLPPGDSQLVVDGVPQPVTVDPNQHDNGLTIKGDDFSMNLDGLDSSGRPLNLAPDGALILNQDRQVQTSGTGFLGSSQVDIYLDPPTLLQGPSWRPRAAEATYVGTVVTKADGSFSGRVTLPAGISVGDHVLQAIGLTKARAPRALSLGVRVTPPTAIVLVKGVRTAAGQHDRIQATGTTTGIEAGVKLTPWIRYSGQSTFAKGKATITVQADGTFTWSRKVKKSKDLTAYVAWGSVQSNRVTWKKIR